MKTITKDMYIDLDICTKKFCKDQKDLKRFMYEIFEHNKILRTERVLASLILLIIFIYKILKDNKGYITHEQINEYLSISKGIFTQNMWHEEFKDEQPFLYQVLSDIINTDASMEIKNSMIFQYICLMYTIMSN